MKLSVIIPIFNEAATMEEILQRVNAVPLPPEITTTEIIAVNDGSTDKTAELLRLLAQRYAHLTVVHHTHNMGKGAALRTGITVGSGDIFLFQDADLEYDPADYTQLLRPLLAGQADVVYGSRFLTTAERRVLYFWHWIGNVVLTLLCNAVADAKLTDMETGANVFRHEVLLYQLCGSRLFLSPALAVFPGYLVGYCPSWLSGRFGSGVTSGMIQAAGASVRGWAARFTVGSISSWGWRPFSDAVTLARISTWAWPC